MGIIKKEWIHVTSDPVFSGASHLPYPKCYRDSPGSEQDAEKQRNRPLVTYPNLRHIAEICSLLAIDLRIVLVIRNPESALFYNPIAGDVSESALLLIEAFHEIRNQLSNIDPSFLASCIDVDADSEKQKELMMPLFIEEMGLLNTTAENVAKRFSSSTKSDCVEQIDNANLSNVSEQFKKLYKEAIVLKNLCYSL